MLAAKAGELDAFSSIVKKHQNALMNFFRHCGVYSDVEDIAQETFLKLYRVRSTYNSFRAYGSCNSNWCRNSNSALTPKKNILVHKKQLLYSIMRCIVGAA